MLPVRFSAFLSNTASKPGVISSALQNAALRLTASDGATMAKSAGSPEGRSWSAQPWSGMPKTESASILCRCSEYGQLTELMHLDAYICACPNC
jgi:hypothetical protein